MTVYGLCSPTLYPVLQNIQTRQPAVPYKKLQGSAGTWSYNRFLEKRIAWMNWWAQSGSLLRSLREQKFMGMEILQIL